MRYEKGHKEATRQHIVDVASRQFRENGAVESRLGGLYRHLGATTVAQLREEGVPRRPHVNDGRIAEADVHGRGAGDVLERPIQGR